MKVVPQLNFLNVSSNEGSLGLYSMVSSQPRLANPWIFRQQSRDKIWYAYYTRISGSFPNRKQFVNVCVTRKAKPVNHDLNTNSNKDEIRNISDNINPYKGADEPSILKETLLTINKGVP